ncbi:hypothetical protein QR77_03380 [Streptomyces sp. 150FB]|uniref:hypothetical protein n=1 Tax=Streptomyces sp. 150FB TaxID=1576605 RepID=UPI000588FD99|nr:hypothetical protein [Streptomyces sp. 150FB]KIF73265.1 hypothetical protein QR77_03380 [Streptomyces sp. 150FB]
MGYWRAKWDRLISRRWGRRLVAVPLAVVALISLVDLMLPSAIHLGPLLSLGPPSPRHSPDHV